MSEQIPSEETVRRINQVATVIVVASTIGIGVWADRAYRRWLLSINPLEQLRRDARAMIREQREDFVGRWRFVRDLVRGIS
jgi:hypothetical protein